MGLNHYRQVFCHSQQAQFAGVYLLNEPVVAQREASLGDEDQYLLQDCLSRSVIGAASVMVWSGLSADNKSLLSNQLARQLDKKLQLVNCPSFLSHYIGETEKNVAAVIADAQRMGTLLMLDSADVLFSVADPQQHIHANLSIDLLLKLCRQQPGLVILDLRNMALVKAFHSRGLPVISGLTTQ